MIYNFSVKDQGESSYIGHGVCVFLLEVNVLIYRSTLICKPCLKKQSVIKLSWKLI